MQPVLEGWHGQRGTLVRLVWCRMAFDVICCGRKALPSFNWSLKHKKVSLEGVGLGRE